MGILGSFGPNIGLNPMNSHGENHLNSCDDFGGNTHFWRTPGGYLEDTFEEMLTLESTEG